MPTHSSQPLVVRVERVLLLSGLIDVVRIPVRPSFDRPFASAADETNTVSYHALLPTRLQADGPKPPEFVNEMAADTGFTPACPSLGHRLLSLASSCHDSTDLEFGFGALLTPNHFAAVTCDALAPAYVPSSGLFPSSYLANLPIHRAPHVPVQRHAPSLPLGERR